VRLFVRTYCQQHNRASTRRETERLLVARFVTKWGARELGEISKADVLKVLDEAVDQGRLSAANHALATIGCSSIGVSPAVSRCQSLWLKCRLNRGLGIAFLPIRGILRVWKAASAMGYPFGTITQLLLLTAQRRSEITSLRWNDLDLAAGQLSVRHLTKMASPMFCRSPRRSSKSSRGSRA
jgi:integrase